MVLSITGNANNLNLSPEKPADVTRCDIQYEDTKAPATTCPSLARNRDRYQTSTSTPVVRCLASCQFDHSAKALNRSPHVPCEEMSRTSRQRNEQYPATRMTIAILVSVCYKAGYSKGLRGAIDRCRTDEAGRPTDVWGPGTSRGILLSRDGAETHFLEWSEVGDGPETETGKQNTAH